jgi:hypothetical protein
MKTFFQMEFLPSDRDRPEFRRGCLIISKGTFLSE